MTVRAPSIRPRAEHRKSGWWVVWLVLSVAVGATLVNAVLWWGSSSHLRTPPPSPTFPSVSASIGGANGSVVDLESGMLGVNVRADAVFSSSQGTVLNSTDVRLVRWPGGGLADRLDPLANGDHGLIYNDSGTTTGTKSTLAEFVEWCRSVSCQSILTLPAEIDNASEARAIVSYAESGLGFRPTYWEVGNEPALWRHFGVPWRGWSTAQNLTPTPTQFASLVAQYIQAVRSVDPTARIIGLGGLGEGSFGQSTWVSSVIARNGPNLSALAIHVYPAGPGFPAEDLSSWFGTLWGDSALPSRVSVALAEMSNACSSCHLALLVDEFQTGTKLVPPGVLTGGYLATYVAAEIVQALGLSLASLDYYDFESGTPGAWLSGQGVSSAGLLLYQGLSAQFGAFALPLNVTTTAHGLLAAGGGPSATALNNLLLVNTNASTGFRVDLSSRFPGAGQSSAWVFNGSSSGPTSRLVGTSGATNWTVPPASLVIFTGVGPIVGTAATSEAARGATGPAPDRAPDRAGGLIPPPATSFARADAVAAPARRTLAAREVRAVRVPRSGTSAS
jgi:hypothetical protein